MARPPSDGVLFETELDLVAPRAQLGVGRDLVEPLSVQVVHVAEAAADHVEGPPAQRAPEGEKRAVWFDAVGDLKREGDGVGAVAYVDGYPLGDGGTILEVAVALLVPPMVVLVRNDFEDPVVEREHVVTPGLFPPQRHQLGHFLGELRGAVTGLRDVLDDVVELPDVVVPRCIGPQSVVVDGADGMVRHRLPPIVVDGAGAEHLEMLCVMAPGFGLPPSPRT